MAVCCGSSGERRRSKWFRQREVRLTEHGEVIELESDSLLDGVFELVVYGQCRRR